VFVNLALLEDVEDVRALLSRARSQRRALFVGVVADRAELTRVRRRLDDAAAEAVADLYGQRRRRETARRSRRTTS
jgi:hypothetical protein